jgi:uncharacterized protein (DUF362 family)
VMAKNAGDRGYVAALSRTKGLPGAIRSALEESGILKRISSSTRIALKPNLTWPTYRPGITTSPEMIQETVRILRETTSHISIVESDGGYGRWTADEAFRGHGFPGWCNDWGVELANLCSEPREMLTFTSGRRECRIPLPVRLLRETDLLISLPVPKIHSMTGLTLSYKNQWGCVPDTMRLRSHYLFNDAIVAINRALKPVVLADGTFFLDRNGPMDGDPIRMDLIIAATNAGAFDLFVSELMGFPWKKVPHLRRAVRLQDMPGSLSEIDFNVHPNSLRRHTFQLRRSLRNWIALTGFCSRFLTWFGYESWFGRVVLHKILYAIVGNPVNASRGL